MKLTFLVAAAIAVVALTGCGSSSDSDSNSSNPATTVATVDKSPVCAARSDFSESVSALTDPTLITGGKSAIRSAFDNVKTNLDALADTAQDTYKPQVDDVKSSLDDLETAVGKIGDGKLTDNLQAIGTAISDVGTSAGALADALKADCP